MLGVVVAGGWVEGYREQRIATAVGEICTYLAEPWSGDETRPLVVMLHGALRNAEVLAEWRQHLGPAADLALVDLPGHGRSSPPAQYTVAAMAAMLGEAIQIAFASRRVLLVGESLGGTIGLVFAMDERGPVRAVLAADPPITTGKLWAVQGNFRRLMAQTEPDSFIHRLARGVFGIRPDGLDEVIYFPILGRLKLPAMIVAGDQDLHPARSVVRPVTLFDAVDEFVTRQLYPHVAFERIADCGHLVLLDKPDACAAVIRRLIDDHVR